MAVVYQIYTDWCLPLEESLYATEELAIQKLENDPEMIASMEEDKRTIQDYIKLDWIAIVPREVLIE